MPKWVRAVVAPPRARCLFARAATRGRDPIATQIQRTERLWRLFEMKGEMLTVAQVLELTGGEVASAQAHMAGLHHHGLLGVLRAGRPLYPAWQLTWEVASSQPAVVDPAWRAVQSVLRAAGWSPDEILLWACSPTGRLVGGACPADRLRDDPSSVVDVAHAIAAAGAQ